MHINEVRQHIANGDLREIERAYGVLVGYPKEETITWPSPGPSAEALIAALAAVCDVLANDDSIMPSGTCDAAGLDVGSTYAQGAMDFFDHRSWWAEQFQSRVAGL